MSPRNTRDASAGALTLAQRGVSSEAGPKREATWVTLDLTSVPALQDALRRMCLSTTAASEFVDPRTYLWVARALGKEDWRATF